MFDIGFSELVIVMVMGLVVLGPERLPKAAHAVGRWIGKVKGTFGNLQSELDREIRAKELAEKLQDPGYRFDGSDESLDALYAKQYDKQIAKENKEIEDWESKMDPNNTDQIAAPEVSEEVSQKNEEISEVSEKKLNVNESDFGEDSYAADNRVTNKENSPTK